MQLQKQLQRPQWTHLGTDTFTSCQSSDERHFPRVKKRKKAEPIPRNAFPHVVEKVSPKLGYELYN